MVKKQAKTSKKEKFDIEKELVFWETYSYDCKKKKAYIERLLNCSCESIEKDKFDKLMTKAINKIPDEDRPMILLKLLVGCPQKDHAIFLQTKAWIKEFCVLEFNKFNVTEIELHEFIMNTCKYGVNEDTVVQLFNERYDKLIKFGISENYALTLICLWILIDQQSVVINNFEINDFLICRIIVNKFKSKNNSDIKDCINKVIPNAISNGTYKKEFLNISFLFSNLEKQLQDSKKKNNELYNHNICLNDKVKCSKDEIQRLTSQVLLLEDEICKKDDEIDQLKKDVAAAENRLKFETNLYAKQFETKISNLTNEVNSIIGNELEGIEAIAQRVSEKDKKMLLLYIKRIRERIPQLGGKNNG